MLEELNKRQKTGSANPIFTFSDAFILSTSPKTPCTMQPIGKAVDIIR